MWLVRRLVKLLIALSEWAYCIAGFDADIVHDLRL